MCVWALGEGICRLWVWGEAPGVGLALKLEHSAGGRGILGLKSVGSRVTDLQNTPGVPGLTKEKATPLTCWVALGQSLILSGPQLDGRAHV